MTKTVIDRIKEYDTSFDLDMLYDSEKYKKYIQHLDGEIIKLHNFRNEFLDAWQSIDPITGNIAAYNIKIEHLLKKALEYEKKSIVLKEKVKTITQSVNNSFSEAETATNELLSIAKSFTRREKEAVEKLISDLNTLITKATRLHEEIEKKHTLLEKRVNDIKVISQSVKMEKTKDDLRGVVSQLSIILPDVEKFMAEIEYIITNAEQNANDVFKKTDYINKLKEDQRGVEEANIKDREQNERIKAKIEAERAQNLAEQTAQLQLELETEEAQTEANQPSFFQKHKTKLGIAAGLAAAVATGYNLFTRREGGSRRGMRKKNNNLCKSTRKNNVNISKRYGIKNNMKYSLANRVNNLKNKIFILNKNCALN
jgi:hypothetical protein